MEDVRGWATRRQALSMRGFTGALDLGLGELPKWDYDAVKKAKKTSKRTSARAKIQDLVVDHGPRRADQHWRLLLPGPRGHRLRDGPAVVV